MHFGDQVLCTELVNGSFNVSVMHPLRTDLDRSLSDLFRIIVQVILSLDKREC